MRRPPRALQTTLGSAVTSHAHSVPLPDDNQPKVEPQTPTSTKADPTLFSQFEVPKSAVDATDQESMYSQICEKVKQSFANLTHVTFAG
jgi:hypothetical protein